MLPRSPRSTGKLADDVSVIQAWINQARNEIEARKVLQRVQALSRVEPLELTISNPPTQNEVTQVLSKLNEVINASRS
jgi:hypothetical protein